MKLIVACRQLLMATNDTIQKAALNSLGVVYGDGTTTRGASVGSAGKT
jgi:hypothetical protein